MQPKHRGKVIIKIHVALVKAFIEIFEQQKEQRQIEGEQSWSICRECGEFNHFTVICNWNTHENAESYWNSEKRQKDIRQWNNIGGKPDIQILMETKFE